MRTVEFTKSFKKAMKDVRSYKNYKESELTEALLLLAEGKKLPDNMRDHAMVQHSEGALSGARAFHLRPNLVVIYKMNDSVIKVINIGLHNKTNLTSSFMR